IAYPLSIAMPYINRRLQAIFDRHKLMALDIAADASCLVRSFCVLAILWFCRTTMSQGGSATNARTPQSTNAILQPAPSASNCATLPGMADPNEKSIA